MNVACEQARKVGLQAGSLSKLMNKLVYYFIHIYITNISIMLWY